MSVILYALKDPHSDAVAMAAKITPQQKLLCTKTINGSPTMALCMVEYITCMLKSGKDFIGYPETTQEIEAAKTYYVTRGWIPMTPQETQSCFNMG